MGRLVHRRRNGRFFLEIAAHPEYGLPFGQDRLVLIWVATLAVRQQSRTVQFDSAAQLLDEFDLPADGPHYRRMVEAFQRVFTSTIFFGTSLGRADALERGRVHFFDALDLWFSPRKVDGSRNENVITLSEAFWNELHSHPIPIQRDAVRALASSPGCLDLYLWLRWRSFGLQRQQVIPIMGANGLAAQLGPDDYGRERDFWRALARWLERIRQVWPTCPCHLDQEGLTLTMSPRNPQLSVD